MRKFFSVLIVLFFTSLRTHSTFKDGGGMGGGGMYMKQGKKRKEEEAEEDMFEYQKDSSADEIILDKDLDEKDIPQDTLFNKFVNWFRIQND